MDIETVSEPDFEWLDACSAALAVLEEEQPTLAISIHYSEETLRAKLAQVPGTRTLILANVVSSQLAASGFSPYGLDSTETLLASVLGLERSQAYYGSLNSTRRLEFMLDSIHEVDSHFEILSKGLDSMYVKPPV